MSRFASLLFVLATMWTLAASGQSPRFIIDDDHYSDQVVRAGQKLLHEHKLLSLDLLRAQVHTKGFALKPMPPVGEKLDPPDLCERLRESTLAVGSLYKCPDCGEWHFTSSSGFIVSEGGIVCTCCHVLTEEDDEIKESYLVAADSAGHVFPVQSVLAADPDADACLLHIGATGLKPLPLRPGARAGESVYCLSHPGGYYFMFTEGLVARLSRRADSQKDEARHSKATQSRPVLLLNITAEFAPGSSGAPVVDTCGNVVAQVASIAEAGESASGDDDQPASPSVPVRFCTASEEILRLMSPNFARDSHAPVLRPAKKPKSKLRQLSQRTHCPLPSRTEP
jgi:hypothetical protein